MESKQSLLAKYEKRDVNPFSQVDFWTDVEPGDCVMVPDHEGDCLTAILPSYELMCGSVVRVLIKKGTSQVEAIRGLKKIVRWVENDSSLVDVGIAESMPGKRISNYVDPEYEASF